MSFFYICFFLCCLFKRVDLKQNKQMKNKPIHLYYYVYSLVFVYRSHKIIIISISILGMMSCYFRSNICTCMCIVGEERKGYFCLFVCWLCLYCYCFVPFFFIQIYLSFVCMTAGYICFSFVFCLPCNPILL